jgi:hypothetical protein
MRVNYTALGFWGLSKNIQGWLRKLLYQWGLYTKGSTSNLNFLKNLTLYAWTLKCVKQWPMRQFSQGKNRMSKISWDYPFQKEFSLCHSTQVFLVGTVVYLRKSYLHKYFLDKENIWFKQEIGENDIHCPKSSAYFREIPRSVYGSKSPGR